MEEGRDAFIHAIQKNKMEAYHQHEGASVFYSGPDWADSAGGGELRDELVLPADAD